MSDRDMLYRAILSYPGEDAPRLLYADAIEDEQPERAEFIRVQCELAKLPPPHRELFVTDGAGNRMEGLGVGLIPEGGGHYSASYLDRLSVDDLQPGERVDIYTDIAGKTSKVVRWMRGMKFVKRREDKYHLIFRRDEHSKPWEGTELRRREQEFFMQWSKNHEPIPRIAVGGQFGYDAIGMNWSLGRSLQGDFRRGFISSLTCSFADWLANHERLFWSPWQTVECIHCPDKPGRQHNLYPGGWENCESCSGIGRIPRPFTVEVECPDCVRGIRRVAIDGPIGVECEHGWDVCPICDKCKHCSGTGRITQPLTTAQPIERVRFSTWPRNWPSVDSEEPTFAHGFTRHPDDTDKNEWYCDRWPGVIFEMPESERNTRTLMATERIVRGQLAANMHGQPAGFAMHDADAGEQVQLMTGNL